MTTSPTFTVAIPIGAWHDFIPATFSSLAAQTPALNVALMDASSDPRVAEAADASGLNFIYRRHGPDQGQSDAIAEGWREGGGDILFWLNGDDRLTEGALKKVATLFDADPELDAVYGHSDFINGAAELIGTHDQVEAVSDLLYRSNIISQPSCFVRRTAVEAVGGLNQALHYVMDWDLWVRLYANGARFKLLPETLSQVYMGEETKTDAVPFQRIAEVFTLVRTHAGLWAACKSTLALVRHTLNYRGERA